MAIRSRGSLPFWRFGSNICPSLVFPSHPLPPARGRVKQNTINLIKTVAEFTEIRNSLGANLLMTCTEMKLWQGQRGCKRQEWRGREGWKEGERRMRRRRKRRNQVGLSARKHFPGWRGVSWHASLIGSRPLRVKRPKTHSYDDTVSDFLFFFSPSLHFSFFSPPSCLSDITRNTAGTSRLEVKALPGILGADLRLCKVTPSQPFSLKKGKIAAHCPSARWRCQRKTWYISCNLLQNLL